MEIVDYNSDKGRQALSRLLSRSFGENAALIETVTEIVERVRAGGDEALIDYTRRYDGVTLKPNEIRVAPDFIKSQARRADQTAVEAFRHAIKNVRAFHQRQQEASWEIMTPDGARLGQRIQPVASAGLYVPGGKAAYPSSVLMNAVPAQVAGVSRVVVSTPPGTLERNPAVAAVIAELGIDEVYRVGGAQAIAALAYGTESIPRVDKVVGPGNKYVAIAKKLVYGAAGIDSLAGPTEVVVLADESANPIFVAADLLAQAEHDSEASAICITTSLVFAREVVAEITRRLGSLDRREIAAASIERYGVCLVVDSIETACELINRVAPEHLELMTSDNDRAASLIENAGAIFFGAWSTEPVGDYIAGPNHVLPTGGTARFSSPLGVYDFVKRQSVISYSKEALVKDSQRIAVMADSEGLTAHKQAVLVRLEPEGRSQPRAAALRPEQGGEVETVGNRARYDPLSRIKPAVRAIRAYTLSPHRASIKINQNENPFDMPEEIKREVLRRLASRPWSRYPDFVPSELIETLAGFAGWIPEGTIAGNGSNELIQATLAVIVGPGARVVIPEPTFTLYRQIVAVLGGEVDGVPLTEQLQFDVRTLRECAVRSRAEAIVISSPNNPTGCRINEADLEGLAGNFPGIVIIDEAYHEFSAWTAVPLLKSLPNLIVLRTFSKAMAMAGLRVGYLLASPEIVREIHKSILPYNINFFSATAAIVACQRYDLLRPRIETIISERARVQKGLGEIPGVEVVPSAANFMLIRTPLSPGDLFDQLLARDILVRNVSSYPMLGRYLRISIGSPAENDRLLAAISEILDSRQPSR